MKEFTGPELAGLLQTGCLIVCEPKTSKVMMEAAANGMIGDTIALSNWIKGVYLITEVEADEATDGEDLIIAVNLSRPCTVEMVSLICPPSEIKKDIEHCQAYIGRKATVRGLRTAKYNGSLGTVVGRPVSGRIDVRLESGKGISVKVGHLKFTADNVEPYIQHYISGPCFSTDDIPTAKGIAILTETSQDELPRYNVSHGGSQGGLWVFGDLKDVLAIARKDAVEKGAMTAQVSCCWGDARWSRVQLLGEIARGSWGICRAEVSDLKITGTTCPEVFDHDDTTWSNLTQGDRLVYAAKSEMTDKDIHNDNEPESLSPEEEGRLAEERNQQMLETRRQLRAQLMAQQEAERARQQAIHEEMVYSSERECVPSAGGTEKMAATATGEADSQSTSEDFEVCRNKKTGRTTSISEDDNDSPSNANLSKRQRKHSGSTS